MKTVLYCLEEREKLGPRSLNSTPIKPSPINLIFNANIAVAFQGTEIHGALSAGHSRTSPVQSYRSTRTSIRQVAKMLAGKSKGFSLLGPQ